MTVIFHMVKELVKFILIENTLFPEETGRLTEEGGKDIKNIEIPLESNLIWTLVLLKSQLLVNFTW